MSLPVISATTFTGQNITSLLEVKSYTTTAAGWYQVQFFLSSLNGAAANFDVFLRRYATGGSTLLGEYGQATIAKQTAANTTWGSGFAPVFCNSGDILTLALKSSNASDTSVAGTLEVWDASDANVRQWAGVVPLALSSQQVQAVVPDSQKVDVNTIKTKAVTVDSGGTTFPASVGTSTYAGADTAGTSTLLSAIVAATATVNDTGATTTVFGTTLASSVNDFYKGQAVVFTSGALAGQLGQIKSYAGNTKTVTLQSALTSAPANGSPFAVVNVAASRKFADLLASGMGSDNKMLISADAQDAFADAILDRANGVETGKTLRQAVRIIAAVLAGKVSGAGTGVERFAGIDGSTERVEVAADSAGNRTAVTYDP